MEPIYSQDSGFSQTQNQPVLWNSLFSKMELAVHWKTTLVSSSRSSKYNRSLKIFYFPLWLVPKFGYSFCEWLSVWLHHKISQRTVVLMRRHEENLLHGKITSHVLVIKYTFQGLWILELSYLDNRFLHGTKI
jgi:hypothetical protein